MIKNYIKIAFRHFFHHKLYTGINMIGLAMGMAVALVIGLWVWDEWSFDYYHERHDHLARIVSTEQNNGALVTSPGVPIPLADELRSKYGADFKRIAVAFPNYTHTLANGDTKIAAAGRWTQPDLPTMLSLKMVAGRQDALNDPSSVLLTQSLAKALFGETDPMNKILRMDNRMDLKVAGVYEDLPNNTTFHDTRLFLPWTKAERELVWLKDAEKDWSSHHWDLIVELNDQASLSTVSAKIRDLAQGHVKAGKEIFSLHPMNKWHLYSEFIDGFNTGGRIRMVRLVATIGLFILLLAMINFMNLATARSEHRAKEIGLRKAIGSLRSQLIGQFLTESVLVALFALMLSILFVQGGLSALNTLTEKDMVLPWGNPLFWAGMLLFTLVTGLLAGSYPAFLLSRFEPVKVLKGNFAAGKTSRLPRQVLIVLQFTVSITLVIGTMVVFRQLQYARNRPAGYTREGLITLGINTPQLYQADYNRLRQDLLETGDVADMAYSSVAATEVPENIKDISWKGKDPNMVPQLKCIAVTHDYGKTMGWQLLDGRDFSREYATDTSSLVINETAARLLGFAHPVGETVLYGGKPCLIRGVVKDMIMESPYQPVAPTLFILGYEWHNFITVRIRPGAGIVAALAEIEQVFRRYNPAAPFEFKFIDDNYARKFSDEKRLGRLAAIFAGLAVFISCLGLFGLSAFIVSSRTKEIGIRKVLGASVFNLWALLSGDFIRLIFIAILIAMPLGYYGMTRWLGQYVYHTTLAWWIFAAASMGAVLVAMLTVSIQSMKAARKNPVNSLTVS
ncbi:ABC transporter permease [Chitinophaga flava]|uniref:ABC transporter permease n=1 Tax=Chitinophaga flava TaxID=2259036 RepID=A0A365XSA2_9BACT|nr:ABC transporter permease [Chitinophaga flava]RBL89246.1 ABC transporter permease [Chitinophaga flava]